MLPSTGFLAARKPRAARLGRTVRYKDREKLDDATVSNLSAEEIRRMGRRELVRVVEFARTPASRMRLDYQDHDTLRRLAHQARLTCRHRNRRS